MGWERLIIQRFMTSSIRLGRSRGPFIHEILASNGRLAMENHASFLKFVVRDEKLSILIS
jgi:hypothetical protein